MNSSDGVSVLDLEASFDSSVGGGDAGGYKPTPKVLICQKTEQIYENTEKNAKFGHRCFDTIVLIV